jgi:GTP-binding protein HflX
MMVNGNTQSLKKSVLTKLEGIYELVASRDEFLPWEVIDMLAEVTSQINREISVYINRKGIVTDVSIGDNSTVTLSEVEGRRGGSRLSGVRCIHTHPNGDGRLSDVDINAMLGLNLDAMCAVGVKEGKTTSVFVAIPEADESGERNRAAIYGPFCRGQSAKEMFFYINETDKQSPPIEKIMKDEDEKAILVGLETDPGKIVNGKTEGERSLIELAELSKTAGLQLVDMVLQKKRVKDPAYYIGKGKIDELSLMVQAKAVDTLVFDDELSGAQIRNIEQATAAKVVDRTTLILDIFAQRARSSEGKLQVELAQLKYRLPRLMGIGGQLSRLGGGIGTRGPGEKQLETDRRHIRRRIKYLEEQLDRLSQRRELLRSSRKKNDIPVVALAGYTNAGKSTLLNKLCDTDVFTENKLFATLDPTTRRLVMPDGREVLLIDTVGFIRKLPHELVNAFKSTLEEVASADILLHVVDASDEEAEEYIPVVEELLRSLGAGGKPTVLVLNKMDLADPDSRIAIPRDSQYVVEISAKTGKGIDELIDILSRLITAGEIEIVAHIPFEEGWAMSYIYDNSSILEKEYTAQGIKVKIRIDQSKIAKIGEFVINPAGEI